jgi:hypothetical protein
MVELTTHKHKEIEMNYIYKALPFKGNVSELDPIKVAAQLTILINSQNQEGWEFYQINSVNLSVSPGCLAALVGAKSFDQKYDMAIFRKIISQEKISQQHVEVEQSLKEKDKGMLGGGSYSYIEYEDGSVVATHQNGLKIKFKSIKDATSELKK